MEAVGNPPKNPDEIVLGGSSLQSELARFEQSPKPKASKEASGTPVLARSSRGRSSSGSQGNGVIAPLATRAVETEVSAVQSIGVRDSGVLVGGKWLLGQTELRIEESGVESGDEREAVKGLGSLLEAKKNEENGAKKAVPSDSSDQESRDGSVEKKNVDGYGISLVVEVGGCIGSVVNNPRLEVGVKDVGNLLNKCEYEDSTALLPENGKHNGGDSAKIADFVPKLSEKTDVEGENAGDQEHQFSVGDFVWGKIKSHPWWPGRIYNSSDASDFAAKYKQRDRLLVAYFGDGSFAWCYPSQLEPFEENFEVMSKQSNSKNFVNAVQEALDEIGRLVELETTCPCIPKENEISLARPFAANAGIKEGAFVPKDGIKRISHVQCQPAKFLADLRYMAQVSSVDSMLQLSALKSWLSAFYRAKGGYQLPSYHESRFITDPDDGFRNGFMDINGFMEVPIQGPNEEHWLPSPVGQTNLSLSQKYPGISEDKLYQRRKQKSMAELMAGEIDSDPEDKEEDTTKQEKHLGKLASSFGKRKRKSSGEAESHDDNKLISPSGRRRKTKLSESPTYPENKGSSGESDDNGSKKEAEKGPESRGRKKRKAPSVENGRGEAVEEIEKVPSSMGRRKSKGLSSENDGGETIEEIKILSRERKKSKYLSPPYTSSLKHMQTHYSSAQMGERMTTVAGQLIGSPPILKCGGETLLKKLSREAGVGYDRIDGSSSKAQNNIIDLNATWGSSKKVLHKLLHAAVNLHNPLGNRSLDMIRGFFSTFRSSIYSDGSNYKAYNKHRPGRKKKFLDLELGSIGKDLKQSENPLPKPMTPESGIKKNKEGSLGRDLNRSDDQLQKQKTQQPRIKEGEAKLDVHKPKQAAMASGVKTADRADGKASSAVLFVSFPPATSLPSKDDLITIFSKFGALNKMETDILHSSYCGRVMFVRTADAEQAFDNSVKSSPFGSANVNYQLQYISAPSKTNEVKTNLHTRASSSPSKGKKTPRKLSATESSLGETSQHSTGQKHKGSQLGFIKQKLEMMTLMLERSGDKISGEMKSNLEGEMKGLLEKVSSMSKSSPS